MCKALGYLLFPQQHAGLAESAWLSCHHMTPALKTGTDELMLTPVAQSARYLDSTSIPIWHSVQEPHFLVCD